MGPWEPTPPSVFYRQKTLTHNVLCAFAFFLEILKLVDKSSQLLCESLRRSEPALCTGLPQNTTFFHLVFTPQYCTAACNSMAHRRAAPRTEDSLHKEVLFALILSGLAGRPVGSLGEGKEGAGPGPTRPL